MIYVSPLYKWNFVLLLIEVLLHVLRVESVAVTEDTLNYTTYLLDSLLAGKNYDRKLRPGFGGPPVVVFTDIEVRSFGPVSESDMTYSMDCYFRQRWTDSRLRFESASLDVLAMNWKFLQKVWIPDTFFLNGKHSYLHKVTVPNKFIRLRKNGELKYSMRLTIKGDCPMHLRKYPLDTQSCPLEIGSFAYPAHELLYEWEPGRVQLPPHVKLSQYDFQQISTSNMTMARAAAEERRSVLLVHFVIQRRRGYFILQIYAPCTLIVGASWVSFWINRADAAARVAVGATTVLTLVTMGFGGRGSLQRVAYATALDWFVIMCFTFVFAALVEYAFVNFIDHYEKQQMKEFLEKEREKKKTELKEEDMKQLEDVQVASTAAPEETAETGIKNLKERENRMVSVYGQSQQLKSHRSTRPTRLGGLRLRPSRFSKLRRLSSKDGQHSRHIAVVCETQGINLNSIEKTLRTKCRCWISEIQQSICQNKSPNAYVQLPLIFRRSNVDFCVLLVRIYNWYVLHINS